MLMAIPYIEISWGNSILNLASGQKEAVLEQFIQVSASLTWWALSQEKLHLPNNTNFQEENM